MNIIEPADVYRPVLPPVLDWVPTPNQGDRRGHPVDLVVVHRWGDRYVSLAGEVAAYRGTVAYLGDRRSQVSAHIVFPGSAVPGHATQMVAWDHYAWAEAAFNPVADEVESADAIWLGHDPLGLGVLARIVAFRLHARNLPAVWSTHRGFCRHADLGAAGGGHTACPTTDLALWRRFVSMVQYEADRGGFRASWGR